MPFLREKLKAKEAGLRVAAVVTLRHMIERDPVGMAGEGLELELLSLLDDETDALAMKQARIRSRLRSDFMAPGIIAVAWSPVTLLLHGGGR